VLSNSVYPDTFPVSYELAEGAVGGRPCGPCRGYVHLLRLTRQGPQDGCGPIQAHAACLQRRGRQLRPLLALRQQSPQMQVSASAVYREPPAARKLGVPDLE
jgi:hypothetical protein